MLTAFHLWLLFVQMQLAACIGHPQIPLASFIVEVQATCSAIRAAQGADPSEFVVGPPTIAQ